MSTYNSSVWEGESEQYSEEKKTEYEEEEPFMYWSSKTQVQCREYFELNFDHLTFTSNPDALTESEAKRCQRFIYDPAHCEELAEKRGDLDWHSIAEAEWMWKTVRESPDALVDTGSGTGYDVGKATAQAWINVFRNRGSAQRSTMPVALKELVASDEGNEDDDEQEEQDQQAEGTEVAASVPRTDPALDVVPEDDEDIGRRKKPSKRGRTATAKAKRARLMQSDDEDGAGDGDATMEDADEGMNDAEEEEDFGTDDDDIGNKDEEEYEDDDVDFGGDRRRRRPQKKIKFVQKRSKVVSEAQRKQQQQQQRQREEVAAAATPKATARERGKRPAKEAGVEKRVSNTNRNVRPKLTQTRPARDIETPVFSHVKDSLSRMDALMKMRSIIQNTKTELENFDAERQRMTEEEAELMAGRDALEAADDRREEDRRIRDIERRKAELERERTRGDRISATFRSRVQSQALELVLIMERTQKFPGTVQADEVLWFLNNGFLNMWKRKGIFMRTVVGDKIPLHHDKTAAAAAAAAAAHMQNTKERIQKIIQEHHDAYEAWKRGDTGETRAPSSQPDGNRAPIGDAAATPAAAIDSPAVPILEISPAKNGNTSGASRLSVPNVDEGSTPQARAFPPSSIQKEEEEEMKNTERQMNADMQPSTSSKPEQTLDALQEEVGEQRWIFRERVRGLMQSEDEYIELLDRRIYDKTCQEAGCPDAIVKDEDNSGGADDDAKKCERLDAFIDRYAWNAGRVQDILIDIMLELHDAPHPDGPRGAYWAIPRDVLVQMAMAPPRWLQRSIGTTSATPHA